MTSHAMTKMLLLLLWASNMATSCWAFVVPPMPTNNNAPQRSPFHKSPASKTTKLHGAAISAVETFFITKPYVSAFLTCSVKASAADWIAQSQQLMMAQTTSSSSLDAASPQEEQQQEPSATTALSTQVQDQEGEQKVDMSRNLAFLLYGGLYQGMAQQFMYSTVFPDMFGHDLDLAGLACQVAFDMTVVGPFLCLPVAYAVKGIFSSTGSSSSSLLDSLWHEGLEKYIHDVTTQGLLFKYWALWTPVNFLTFGVIPAHFRVAFVAAVSFFWVFILSSTAASSAATPTAASDSSAQVVQEVRPASSSLLRPVPTD